VRRVLNLSLLDTPLQLDPQVALRPEPFGALAYHYGTRRLVFLKNRDVVAVAQALDAHPSLSAALQACGIAESRWPSFAQAFATLNESEIVRERPVSG
jgi:putative mycofactocin binding protein MftB